MSSSDFLNAERNLGLRNVLNKKNEQILFSDILSIKVFSDFKSNINTFADKTVLITNKVLWVFEQCTKYKSVLRFNIDGFYKVVFDDIARLCPLYKDKNKITDPNRAETDSLIISLVGNIHFWVETYPKRRDLFVDILEKAVSEKSFCKVPIIPKSTDWAEKELFRKEEHLPNHNFFSKWFKRPILKSAEVLSGKFLTNKKRVDFSKKYVCATCDAVLLFPSKSDFEIARFFYSHSEDEVSGELPFQIDCAILSNSLLVDVRYLKEEKKMFGLTIRGNKKRFDNQKQFKITSKCLEEIAQFSYSLRFDDEETKNIWQNLFTNRYEVLRQQMGVKMLVDSDQSNNSELSGKKMSGYEELEENYALLTNSSE